MRRNDCRLAVVALVSSAFLAACGDVTTPTPVPTAPPAAPPAALPAGAIQVTTATSGSDQDPDGYTVRLNRTIASGEVTPATFARASVSGTMSISVAPGSYVVSLDGAAGNCGVPAESGGPTRQVDVAAGATVAVYFAVTCALIPVVQLEPGVQLAFVRGGSIYRVSSDGIVRLTDSHDDADPAWSPDGRRIAFSRGSGLQSQWGWGLRDIYVMDADGANVVRRTSGGYNREPSWSPDGRKIAFASQCDGQGCIYVASAGDDATSPLRVGFDRGVHESPAWSPDGGKIAFTSDWEAFDFVYDIYVTDADGSGITQLTHGFGFSGSVQYYFQPAWSPDGRRIALVVCGWAWDNCYPDSNIAIMKADGSGLTVITSAGGFAKPTWSPDGTQLAFSSTACRDCASAIYIVRSDGIDRRRVVADGHSPSWRP